MKSSVKDPIKILYYDNHLLVVEKRPLQVTQGENSIEEEAKEWIKESFKKEGAVFLQPIHRLDKAVSGIIVFARTSKALSRLQKAMREKKIKKTYLCRVQGKPPKQKENLEHFLVHDEFFSRVVSQDTPHAKRAILHYEVVGESQSTSLLKIDLVTGRYHQIRSQLSAIGCPIVGDTKYGSTFASISKGIDLHHVQIELSHPTQEKVLIFESICPFFEKV